MAITSGGNIMTLGQMIHDYDLPKAVINYYDWNTLFDDARAFAAFSHFGKTEVAMPKSPSGAGNYEILFNKPTGVQTEYKLGTAITSISDCDHLEYVGRSTNKLTFTLPVSATTLNGYLGGLVNVHLRPGLGFRVIGKFTIGGTANTESSISFAIKTIGASTIECILMDSQYEGGSSVALTQINSDTTWYLTEYADFDGEAPEADDMGTTQDSNFLQMYDTTIGKGYSAMSQSTYFDNSFETLFKPTQSASFRKFNQDILFGISGSVPTVGCDKGAQKGVWGLMNLHDPSKNTDAAKPLIKVGSGTTLDYWNLADFIDQRPTYCNKNMLCILTPKMLNLLQRSAYEQRGDLVRTQEVEFPTCKFTDTIVTVGSTKLHCIEDTALINHPKFYDGTSAASRGYVMLMLDPRYIGIKYQENKKLGLMIPQMSNIDPINGERREKAHYMACFTTAVWNKQMHCFYGLNIA